LALAPLIYFGSEQQKGKWLTAYCKGQQAEDGPYLATYGFTDIDGAANFDSLDPSAGFRTHAKLDGDHYIINGAKYFATNGTGWDRKGAWLYTASAGLISGRMPVRRSALYWYRAIHPAYRLGASKTN
jgi:alkylation response protein AidB-like acyl-CoA dehydrogenase